jgi:hypothetical protein
MAVSQIKRRSLLLYAAIAGLASGLTFVTAFAWSQTTGQNTAQPAGVNAWTMKNDLVNRSRDIHWPDGFDPSSADLFSHNELLIDASCERAWDNIIDATKWPQWYPNSKDVRIIDGAMLAEGTVFRWETFGLPIESKINEFAPYTRIGWYGYAPGKAPAFYHTWFLTQTGDACLVVTDEAGIGKDAAHLRETDGSLMHRGHDLWLATLKWVAESR